VDYLKGSLSAIASLILAVWLPSFVFTVREMSRSKTTGLGAVAGGFTGSLFSSTYLPLVLLFILLFYASSRLKSKALRIVLFWIPTVLTSVLGWAVLTMFTYLLTKSRDQ
jgi:hypothetical protein